MLPSIHRTTLILAAAVAFALHCCAGLGAGETWPQFRGPEGQGETAARRLPVSWSESSNIRWKAAVPGRGWSSPVVWGDQIWLTTATDEGRSLRAMCFSLRDGSQVHDVEVFNVDSPIAINAKNSFASPTPVVEVGRLYMSFGTQGTAALDTTDGRVLWTTQELALDHKEGPGSSPMIWQGLLILNCDGIDAQYVAALDKQSGQLAWKTTRSGEMDPSTDFRKAYSTPLVIRAGGIEELISVGADQVVAYQPASGAELWKVRFKGFSNVPRPLFNEGMLYICTGYMRPELWALRLNDKGQATDHDVVWREPEQIGAIPSPVLLAGHIYVVSNSGVASCLDAQTGALLWRKRLGGNFSASPLAAIDRVYFANEEGQSFVVGSGSEYELLAKNELNSGQMASPAVIGDTLLIRTETDLYRIEEVDQAARP